MSAALLLFFASFLISYLITPIIRNTAQRFKAFDLPDRRKIHSCAIPRIGGIAIYLGFMVPLLASHLLPNFPLRFPGQTGHLFFVGTTLIFLLGVLDDFRGLDAWKKLPVQIIAAIFIALDGYQINSFPLPFGGSLDLGPFGLIVTVFWLVGLGNAINLIDGLDGLAGGISTIGALTLFSVLLMAGNVESAGLPILLAGSTIGFLRYNFYPAKIFMGDSGSLFLGFTLGAVALQSFQELTVTVPLLVPIVALGIPIADTLFSMVRRFINGTSIFSADKEHFHHKLILKGFTHRQAVLLLYAISASLGLASIIMTMIGHQVSFYALPILAFGLVGGLRFLGYVELSQAATLLATKPIVIRAPRCKRLLLGRLNEVLCQKKEVNELYNVLQVVGSMLELDRVSIKFYGVNGPAKGHYLYEWKNPSSNGDPSLWSVTVPFKAEDGFIGNMTFTKLHSRGSHYSSEDVALASVTGECVGQWLTSLKDHENFVSANHARSRSLVINSGEGVGRETLDVRG